MAVFLTSAPKTVTIIGGQTTNITFTYAESVAPPVITSAVWVEGQRGQALTYQLTTTQSPGSYSLAGTLPAGLSLDPVTGVRGGVLEEAGVFVVTVGATNAGGTGTMTLAISSKSAIANQCAFAVLGEPLNYQIVSSASVGRVSYAAYGLPPGWPLIPPAA